MQDRAAAFRVSDMKGFGLSVKDGGQGDRSGAARHAAGQHRDVGIRVNRAHGGALGPPCLVIVDDADPVAAVDHVARGQPGADAVHGEGGARRRPGLHLVFDAGHGQSG